MSDFVESVVFLDIKEKLKEMFTANCVPFLMSFNSIDWAGDCFNGFSFSKPSLVNLLESPHIGCTRLGSTSASISMGREVSMTP